MNCDIWLNSWTVGELWELQDQSLGLICILKLETTTPVKLEAYCIGNYDDSRNIRAISLFVNEKSWILRQEVFTIIFVVLFKWIRDLFLLQPSIRFKRSEKKNSRYIAKYRLIVTLRTLLKERTSLYFQGALPDNTRQEKRDYRVPRRANEKR